MVRQYIGARYVIKVYENSQDHSSADWEPSINYEPLTLVTYNYGSYLSKKEVPASIGDPASNPDYWVQTGFYNGQITFLQNQIDALNSEIKTRTPEFYGAVGDGVTDDTTAIQECLNNGGIIVMNNNYLVSDTLEMKPDSQIIGDGTITSSLRDTIILMDDNCSIEGLSFTDDLAADASSGQMIYAKDKKFLEVKFCNFDTIGNGHGVLFEHCEHIVIENNYFKDYGFSGIMLIDSCKFVSIQFNNLYNARYRGGEHNYPICFSGYQLVEHGEAQFIKVNYNSIEEVAPYWEGIDSHGAKDYEIIGNRIINCRYGIACGSGPTSIPDADFTTANSNAIIKNNYIDVHTTDNSLSSYGIHITTKTGGVAKNLLIENNYVKVNCAYINSTPAHSAIVLRPDGSFYNVVIKNNTLNAKNAHCISMDGSSMKYIEIDNNYFEDISGGLSFYCINLASVDSWDDLTITNNAVDDGVLDTAARFILFPSPAPISKKLAVYSGNNNKGLAERSTEYTTAPQGVLSNIVKANYGISGQFIPNKTTGATVAGWYCLDTGDWLAISGTSA